tara:strand:- start:1571 stop:2068 length:498 start_codon:yes stop_codon:yes gene_type:complete
MKKKAEKKEQENNQPNEKSGAKLIHWLNQRSIEKGISKGELSKFLGVSSSYLNQLQSGEKQIKNIGDDFINKCVELLQASRLAVLIAAEKITQQDFYGLSEKDYEEEIEAALHFILKDKNIGTIIPSEILSADFKIKEMTVLLFEKLSGKTLVGNKVNLSELFKN